MESLLKIFKTGDKFRKSRFHSLRGDFMPILEIPQIPVELVLRFFRINRKGPWLSKPAIRALEVILKTSASEKLRILEIGGGASTQFFLKYSPSVTTIEENAKWASHILKKSEGSEALTLVIANLSEWLNTINEKNARYDIVLIDGGTDEERLKALNKLYYIVPNCLFVLDNSDRAIFKSIDTVLAPSEIIRFRGLLRNPFQVTETTFLRK